MRKLLASACAAALALALAACSGSGQHERTDAPWTLGTTDVVTSLDPAGAYDTGSWTLQYELYQQLVTIPAGDSDPEPDAAKSCDYTDGQTVKCELHPGLVFSNGDPLTSSDVAFSLRRVLAIDAPTGPAVLLSSLASVDTPDDTTVVFHLDQPDQTFLQVLTTAAASIVDEDLFPGNTLLPDAEVVGSGPYTLTRYAPGSEAVLAANPEYGGPHRSRSAQVTVSYFGDSAALQRAVTSGQVDVAWRSFSPDQLQALDADRSLRVTEGKGAELRYWVWDMRRGAGTEQAVRQAVAQVVDRAAIARIAYDGTVAPAYSVVPPGVSGEQDSFADLFGDPSVDRARAILEAASVPVPVPLTLGYPEDNYADAVNEADELASQLDHSGLFTVRTDTAPWTQYQGRYEQGVYDLFLLGWQPDFLDADDYLSPFLRDGGFFENGYRSDVADLLLDQERAETDASKRTTAIHQLQDLVAEDVPLIPTEIGKNVAVASAAMDGVADTLDPSYVFRFWMVSKGGVPPKAGQSD